MLEHLFPEGKLVVSDFGGPVVRRPVAKILILVIAAGRGDRAAGLVAGLAADPRDIGEAAGAVVGPVVPHQSVDHRAFGRRDLPRRMRVTPRPAHDEGARTRAAGRKTGPLMSDYG